MSIKIGNKPECQLVLLGNPDLIFRGSVRYDSCHSSSDTLRVTNTASKYVNSVINNGSIRCNKSYV